MKQTFPVASRTPMRLDLYLVAAGVGLSRTRIQALIKEGRIVLNGASVKASRTVQSGDAIEVDFPYSKPTEMIPEDIPLDILYEDDVLLVLNKPAGMVTHPAVGHWAGTLVHALLHHCGREGGSLAVIGGRERPGIVHRLDKDTSGVMVIARTDLAHRKLSAQFKDHTIDRRYLALVCGKARAAGTITLPIGRDTHDRKKVSAKTLKPREAATRYVIRERMKIATLVEVYPQTGRTHQIRVHMAHIGHPVVGDKVYGGKVVRHFPIAVARQMLHAERLGFIHPTSGETLCFSAPPPSDMQEVLEALTQGSGGVERSAASV